MKRYATATILALAIVLVIISAGSGRHTGLGCKHRNRGRVQSPLRHQQQYPIRHSGRWQHDPIQHRQLAVVRKYTVLFMCFGLQHGGRSDPVRRWPIPRPIQPHRHRPVRFGSGINLTARIHRFSGRQKAAVLRLPPFLCLKTHRIYHEVHEGHEVKGQKHIHYEGHEEEKHKPRLP